MTAKTELPDALPCARCNGLGVTKSTAWTSQEGRHYPERISTCYGCDGAKVFTKPDTVALIKSILSKKARRGLVSKRPKDDRAAYLWRWIRFNGGDDVTIPMTFGLSGDPYEEHLNDVAEYVAFKMYGHRSAGIARWGNLLTNNPISTAGMPWSAQPGGTVVSDDHDKTTMAMLAEERANIAAEQGL